MIVDIAELIRANPGIDWERVMVKAGTFGIKRMLFLGICLARDLLGTDIPQAVLQNLRADSAVKSLARGVCQRLFLQPNGVHKELERVPFHLKLRETLLDRVRYLFRLLMTPTTDDWDFLPLPPRLFHLYAVLRPLRLFVIQPIWRYVPYPVRVTIKDGLALQRKFPKPP